MLKYSNNVGVMECTAVITTLSIDETRETAIGGGTCEEVSHEWRTVTEMHTSWNNFREYRVDLQW